MMINILNRIAVKKKRVFVFLVSGQSNSNSKALIGSESGIYPLQNKNIRIYVKPDDSAADNGIFQAYDPESGNNINVVNRDLGHRHVCEVAALGELLYQELGEPVYFIKMSRGAIPLYQREGDYESAGADFNVNSVNDYHEILTQRYILPALKWLRDNGRDPVVLGMSWHQGETDGTALTMADAYKDCRCSGCSQH